MKLSEVTGTALTTTMAENPSPKLKLSQVIGTPSQETPAQPMKLGQIMGGEQTSDIPSGDQFEGFRQEEINQKKQASAMQAFEQQIREKEKMNPSNWTSKQMQEYYKKNPPQNIEEQAQANAALEFKKKQEKELTNKLTGLAGPTGRYAELAKNASTQDIPGIIASTLSSALGGVPEIIAKNPVAAGVELGADIARGKPGISLFPETKTDAGKQIADEASLGASFMPMEAVAAPIQKGLSKITQPVQELAIKSGYLKASEKQINHFINEGISKGIRPTVVGKNSAAQADRYFDKARDAVKTIVENKNDLNLVDEFGEARKGLPKTLNEFSQAVDQVKTKIFNEYDSLAKQAGGKGLKLDLSFIADDIEKQVNNKAVKTLYPELKQQAMEIADRLRTDGEFTPQEAQEAIEMLNNSLKAFYRNPNPQAATRSVLDAAIATKIRKGLDDLIEGATGESYKELKNKYGSLRTIQEDVTKRAIVDARKNAKGFFDLTDVFATGDIVKGLATMDPASLAKGGGMHIIKRIFQHMNNPNTAVKNMFSFAEKAYKPKVLSEVIEKTPKLLEASKITKTQKLLTGPKTLKLLEAAKDKGEGFEILTRDDAINRIKSAPEKYSFSNVLDLPDSVLDPVQLALKYYTQNSGKIVFPKGVIESGKKANSLKRMGINPFTGKIASEKLKTTLEIAMKR